MGNCSSSAPVYALTDVEAKTAAPGNLAASKPGGVEGAALGQGPRGRVSFDSTEAQNTGPRRPRRIVIVRHGQSQGNVDESTYAHTPDWTVELTEQGIEQAREAGRKLAELRAADATKGPVFIYSSPYKRCQQTANALIEGAGLLEEDVTGRIEEPRIREQDFGNFQDIAAMTECKAMRNRFGRFFYRFPNGESGADVYDRVSTWLESLFREMEFGGINEDTTVVLVTHGLTARLFLMRWYHWSVEIFEETRNPGNAQLMVMEREMTHGGVYYNLTKESREQITLPEKAVKHEDVERRRQMKISGNMFSFSQKAAKMNSFAASDENSTAA
ncbi:hypothetical protein AB1Y20_001165 [Prymnesium parvum]|uniref:Phosphoglycerate mutase n=1 Tax=Prymnesium parvum TaxID=97485 RepID=A0AB34K7E5_PRYPA